MGDKQILLGMMGNARTALQTAQIEADKTPRPVDACPAHDSQFAVTKASSFALDALLMAKEDEIRESMASKMQTHPEVDESELSISSPAGKVSAKGRAATNLSMIAAVVFGIVGIFYYISKANRDDIEKSLKEYIRDNQQTSLHDFNGKDVTP